VGGRKMDESVSNGKKRRGMRGQRRRRKKKDG
jgi:hypothetical protein